MTPSRELAYQILGPVRRFWVSHRSANGCCYRRSPAPEAAGRSSCPPSHCSRDAWELRFLFENYPEFAEAFRCLRFLVLDEADRLVSGGHCRRPFRVCVVALSKSAKTPRQTLLFTATADSSLTDVAGGVLPRLGVVDQQSLVACCCSSESLTLSNKLYTIAPHLDEKYLFVPNEVKLAYALHGSACNGIGDKVMDCVHWVVPAVRNRASRSATAWVPCRIP